VRATVESPFLQAITGQLISGFGTLDTAAQFGSTDAITSALNRLAVPSSVQVPEWLSGYASSRAAAIRRTSTIATTRAGLFSGTAGFAAGGVVGTAPAAAAPVVVQPNITAVFEGDLAALDLRVKRVVVNDRQTEARAAGLSRQTAAAPGRRSRL
jgi:hypothetical protein